MRLLQNSTRDGEYVDDRFLHAGVAISHTQHARPWHVETSLKRDELWGINVAFLRDKTM